MKNNKIFVNNIVEYQLYILLFPKYNQTLVIFNFYYWEKSVSSYQNFK